MAEKYKVKKSSSSPQIIDDDEEKKSVCCCLSFFCPSEATPLKILLIGTGGCGKSTIMKQINNHSKNKLKGDDKIDRVNAYQYLEAIKLNILTNTCNLVKGMRQIGLEFGNAENESYANEINELHSNLDINEWNRDKRGYADKVISIWNDNGIKQAYARRNEFFLDDSTEYFMHNIDRIIQDSYLPSFADILRVRQPTTEIINHKIKIQDTPILFVDVGGQINEREKWISTFENITSLMFVVSLSDYDLYLSDEELHDANYSKGSRINRLKESLNIFNWVVNRRKLGSNELLFKNTGIILFFNKIDLFDAKIDGNKLKQLCFNDFNPQDVQYQGNKAKEFIKKKFVSCISGGRQAYSHFTCAVDPDCMNVVIDNVKNVITSLIIRSI